ncbi:MAG: diacylglycerol kinase family protein [Acidimicrobiales bacterium]|nr:NAD(+)/NADH kinase [Acidimicrobiales bacterium]MCB1261913.1 NAD(+)/NADH kinase [Acidimicrobiales bacterium]
MPADATTEPPLQQRLLAVLALVLGASTIVALTAFVFTRLLLLLAVDLLVVLAIWGLWESLTQRGMRSVLAGLGAAVATTVVVVLLLASDSALGLVVVLAMVACSGAAARAALAHHVHEPAARDAPVALAPVVFMNPRSGGGKVESFDLVRRAEQYGARVVLLGPDSDLAAMAQEAIDDGADLLGAAGGDGTQALVAQVCADNRLPFLCIPAGTRNHFALDLGLDRDDPSLALSGLAADAEEVHVDLADVDGRPFVNNVSMGVYAKVIQSPDYRDDKLGTFADLLPDLVGEDAEPFDLACVTPDGAVQGPELLMVSNNPYQFSSLTDFGTRERLDSGLLGVVVAQVDSASAAAQVVRLSAIGQVDRYEGWRTFTAASFTVTSTSGTIDAGIDGEAVRLPAPASFRIRPGALRVRLPRHRPGVRASAPRFESATFGRLWRVALGRA